MQSVANVTEARRLHETFNLAGYTDSNRLIIIWPNVGICQSRVRVLSNRQQTIFSVFSDLDGLLG